MNYTIELRDPRGATNLGPLRKVGRGKQSNCIHYREKPVKTVEMDGVHITTRIKSNDYCNIDKDQRSCATLRKGKLCKRMRREFF